MAKAPYANCVFVNCPFDAPYEGMFRALVFAVHDCGFIARSALETVDAGEVRIQKIFRLIKESKYGIHDLSRTELDTPSRLPRFNMPLELGVFMGAREFGSRTQRAKVTLIFERRKYSYQKYCSDIAGQDIAAHLGRQGRAVTAVRNWLSTHSRMPMPSGAFMAERFQEFRRQLPRLCTKAELDHNTLTFADYSNAVVEWLKADKEARVRGGR